LGKRANREGEGTVKRNPRVDLAATHEIQGEGTRRRKKGAAMPIPRQR